MEIIKVERIASKGLAMGKALLVVKTMLVADNYVSADQDRELEIYDGAVKRAAEKLEKQAQTSAIFAGQLAKIVIAFCLRMM